MRTLAAWPRPHHQPGGQPARLLWHVYGRFEGGLRVSRSRHRSRGVPLGGQLRFEDLPVPAGGDPHRAVLSVTMDDPTTLNYLRDAIGVVQALLEGGGTRVHVPSVDRWWSAGDWFTDVFDVNGPNPDALIGLHTEPEDDATTFRTTGLPQFARPDFIVPSVPVRLRDAASEMCYRFVHYLALGGQITHGQPIRMRGLPPWVCTVTPHAGPNGGSHVVIGPPSV